MHYKHPSSNFISNGNPTMESNARISVYTPIFYENAIGLYECYDSGATFRLSEAWNSSIRVLLTLP